MTRPSSSKPATPQYRCVVGFNHEPKTGTHRRFEPGDTVTGLPASSAKSLAEDGVIEALPAKPSTSRDDA